MNTINFKEISDNETGRTFHNTAMQREFQERDNPIKIVHENNTVAQMLMPSPGVLFIESRMGDSDTEIISAGIHGNEMAGVHRLNALVNDIVTGQITVNKNVLVMLGNLKSLDYRRGGDGVQGNLNRQFNRGEWKNPVNYEQIRANLLMKYLLQSITPQGQAIHTDLHQSFIVPKLSEVRGLSSNDYPYKDQYNFMMAYPLNNNYELLLSWVKKHLSHVIAGVCINDMTDPSKYTTFAGFSAANGAIAGTYEMGQIGDNGGMTYTHQVFDALRARIQGFGTLVPKKQTLFDTWHTGAGPIKESNDFTFLDRNGNPTSIPPIDFMPVNREVARQGNTNITLSTPGSRMLFANADVPIGDRVGVEVNPSYYEGYTHKWIQAIQQ